MTITSADVQRVHKTEAQLLAGGLRLGQKGIATDSGKQVHRLLSGGGYLLYSDDTNQMLLSGDQSASGLKEFVDGVIVKDSTLIISGDSGPPPITRLHVLSGPNSVITDPDNDVNLAVFESTQEWDQGISIIGHRNYNQWIAFGSSAENFASILSWNHDSSEMTLGTWSTTTGRIRFITDGLERFQVTSAGVISMGDDTKVAFGDQQNSFIMWNGTTNELETSSSTNIQLSATTTYFSGNVTIGGSHITSGNSLTMFNGTGNDDDGLIFKSNQVGSFLGRMFTDGSELITDVTGGLTVSAGYYNFNEGPFKINHLKKNANSSFEAYLNDFIFQYGALDTVTPNNGFFSVSGIGPIGLSATGTSAEYGILLYSNNDISMDSQNDILINSTFNVSARAEGSIYLTVPLDGSFVQISAGTSGSNTGTIRLKAHGDDGGIVLEVTDNDNIQLVGLSEGATSAVISSSDGLWVTKNHATLPDGVVMKRPT